MELPPPQHTTMPEGQNGVAPAQLPMKDPDTVGPTQYIVPGEGALVSQLQKLPIQTAHLLLIRKNVWSQMQVYSWCGDGVFLFPTVHVTDPLNLITSILLSLERTCKVPQSLIRYLKMAILNPLCPAVPPCGVISQAIQIH